ncbi:hypothetical protein SAY86_017118 [Trapa natans]|uniref:C2 NT-type domain-containing protein n=1 Tax=Trapa natans TaxID=22666 RepID=A0AAN7R2F0_TRANT|nr:hypothetical protein SAY86_017118 [Trapa natans]
MLRQHKQKSDALGERFDFNLSDLQALKVPKGWDKLSLSIIFVETGKTFARLAPASVGNGSCQWTESFSESVWIPTDLAPEDIEGCLLKVIVFMGSSRSGTLGEATIDMASFTSSRNAVPVSFPLNKCSHGTVFQMKVQCLNPRTKVSDEAGKDTVSSTEEAAIDHDDIDNKSDVSDNLSHISSGSALSNQVDIIVGSEMNFSGSDSHHSFNSGEVSSERESFSSLGNLSITSSSYIGRQDSASSNTSLGHDSIARANKSISSTILRSRGFFQNEGSQRSTRSFRGPSFRSSDNSKELTEAAEVEELRAEIRMWEKKSRKVTADLEKFQKMFSDELEQKETLELELSTSKTECDGLRWEIGKLEVSLKELSLKQNVDNTGNLRKEFEEEIKFLKESNTNLSMQLQKTQESNVELVSILQEMEETIEKQKQEIADLLAMKSEGEQGNEENNDHEMEVGEPVDSTENNINEVNTNERNLILEIESLKLKVQELERDCNELTDENLQLLFKLKESPNLQISDSHSNASGKECQEDELFRSGQRRLESRIHYVEEQLSMKNGECLNLQNKCAELEDHLQTFRVRVSQLDVELCESHAEADGWETRFSELEKQFEDYKKQREVSVVDDANFSSSPDDIEMMKGTYFVTQGSEQEAVLDKLVDKKNLMEKEDSEKNKGTAEVENPVLTLNQQPRVLLPTLESKSSYLHTELLSKALEMDNTKAEHMLNPGEADALGGQERELERRVSQIDEKSQLVLANEVLKRKLSELKLEWSALEEHLSELEKDNVSLSERICGLEAQLRYLTDEREMSRSALQVSESRCLKLQEDVSKLESRIKELKVDLREKLNELQKQLLETKEECGYLRIANKKLEATAESVIEECSLLQKSNTELRAENLELNGNFMVLQAELTESNRVFAQLSAEIEVLLDKCNSVLEETALKESAINAELDALLLENKRNNTNGREVVSTQEGEITNEVSIELEAKLLQLMRELSGYKQKEDVLIADREKLLLQLENFKSNEMKTKSHIRKLEFKIKQFEYEKKHLVEEMSILKDQVQKAELLQTEAANLRITVDEAKSENECLRASFEVLLRDHEETKSERDLLSEKISSMETTVRELETCRDTKVALEERVLRLQGDLTAREALYAEDAQLKNELARIRRINNQLQIRVQGYEKRAQTLEEELMQKNGTVSSSVSDEEEPSTDQMNEIHEEESHKDSSQAEVASGPKEDPLLKIQLLEIELAEAIEANGMYKEQLKSLLSIGAIDNSGSSIEERRRAGDMEPQQTVSSLENELSELRESYLHMSLKYAQGEAEREELLMRLNAA